MSNNDKNDENKIKYQLGDIIQIKAPTDTSINDHIFFIKYIDSSKIVLLEENGTEYTLTIDETTNQLMNPAVREITILSRAIEPGYAKQNNLLIGIWVDIFFNVDVPLVLTGKITDLEEDMIEITTYPDNKILYIDFAYEGIPADLSIEKIVIRPVPAEISSLPAVEEALAEEAQAPAAEEQSEAGEEEELLPIEPQGELTFDIGDIQFGEILDEVTQIVDVPEKEQRFGIDQQTADLLDELISDIPNIQRNERTINNIHTLIERFKQLRSEYSLFDQQGNAQLPAPLDGGYKPLVNILRDFKQKLYWVLPVSKINKKIYDVDSESSGSSDVIDIQSNQEYQEMNDIIEKYKSGGGGLTEEGNNYKYLIESLDAAFTPFQSPVDKENTCSSEVAATITAIVNNGGNIDTHVFGNEVIKEGDNKKEPTITTKKFFLQDYTTGMTCLETSKVKGGNDIIKRKQITKNDTITFDSLMLMPVETINFSAINLPLTDVLERSALNKDFLNYSIFLNHKTHFSTEMLEDLNQEQKYDETFLKEVKYVEYINTALDQIGLSNKEEYQKFLQAVLPNTNFLIDYMKPLMQANKLSVYHFLTLLEPFMVYNKDLHISHYNEINQFINESIVRYKQNFLSMRKFYANKKIDDLLAKKNTVNAGMILNQLFVGNESVLEQTMRLYGFNSAEEYDIFTYSELMNKLNAIDNGILFNDAVSLLGLNLMIDDSLVEQQIVQMNDYIKNVQAGTSASETGTGTGTTSAEAGAVTGTTSASTSVTDTAVEEANALHCKKYQNVSKRYLAKDELEEDNNIDIYFDKQYDTTFYDIIKDIKFAPETSADVKMIMIKEKLMKDNKLTAETALRDAKAMLVGKRLVEEGDLAILQNDSGSEGEEDSSVTYYLRKNNAWVLDESIDQSIFTDKPKLLCNLDEKCLTITTPGAKGKETNKCETLEAGGNEIKMKNLKKVLDEFDAKLQLNKEMTKQKIENEINNASLRIKTLIAMKETADTKYDRQKQSMGNTAEETSALKSPYASLRDTILGLEDYGKKQTYLDKFATYCTRQPTLKENQFWLYCVLTDTKLLPVFLIRIADAYIKKSGYKEILNTICKEQGKLSDDGDAWVDKESGYTIRMIEFNTDEEYTEEGFKMVTRDVLQADEGEKIVLMAEAANAAGAKKEKERKFDNPLAQKVFTIVSTLTKFMHIKLDDKLGFIIRNVVNQISLGALIPKEAEYKKMVEEMLKSGSAGDKKKKPDDYETAFNKVLIVLTLCYFLIAIQTNIPSIKTGKTFPGCKKSYTGYPMMLQGGDDRTAVEYIACIVGKLEKRNVKLWKSIASMKEKDIIKRMEVYYSEFILKTDDVIMVKKEKADYLLTNQEEEGEPLIPLEHSIKRWSSFLPLLHPTHLQAKQLADVSRDFKDKFLQMLKTGNKEQEEMIGVMQAKIVFFSLGIQELIQKIVEKKMTILKNGNGDPLLENSCCNDNTETNNPLKYFIKEQPEIGTLNDSIKRLGDLLYDLKSMSKASILYDPSSKTLRKLIKPPANFTEETIYRAVIFFCKYNSSKPVRADLKAICMEKPAGFNMNEPIESQIKNLKNNGHNYTNDYLQQLLAIVNTNNKVEIKIHHTEHNEAQKNRLDILKAILAPENAVEDERNEFKNFRNKFGIFLVKFNENGVYEGAPNDIREFKNYIATRNDAMKTRIFNFIKENSREISLDKNELKRIEECLDQILVFQPISGGDKHYARDEQDGIYTYDRMINFIKMSVRRLTREVPSMIINNVSNKNILIPKYLNLAKRHEEDLKEIVNKHYKVLEKLANSPIITSILKKSLALTRDLELLVQNTELNTYTIQQIKGSTSSSSKLDIYDIQLSKFLLKFYFYSILDNLMSIKESDISTARNKEENLSGLTLRTPEEEEEEEEEYLTEEMLAGKQKKLEESLAEIIVTFSKLICNDKEAINQNYTTLMEKVQRARDKEKDDITSAFKEMGEEERTVQDIFKENKLERWSMGLQKGLVSYSKKTYEDESLMMEKQALLDIRRSRQGAASSSIDDEDLMADDAEAARVEEEEYAIHYAGEAENEDYDDMDGDEYVP